MDDFPSSFVFAHQAPVGLAVEIVEFTLHFTEVAEAGRVYSGLEYRTPWLARMGAIAEPAAGGEFAQVVEAGIQLLWRSPQLDFAKPRHINEQPPSRHHKHRSRRGGM